MATGRLCETEKSPSVKNSTQKQPSLQLRNLSIYLELKQFLVLMGRYRESGLVWLAEGGNKLVYRSECPSLFWSDSWNGNIGTAIHDAWKMGKPEPDNLKQPPDTPTWCPDSPPLLPTLPIGDELSDSKVQGTPEGLMHQLDRLKIELAEKKEEIKAQSIHLKIALADKKASHNALLERKEEINKHAIQLKSVLASKEASHKALIAEKESFYKALLAEKEASFKALLAEKEESYKCLLTHKEDSYKALLDKKEEERAEIFARWVKEFLQRRKLFNTIQELRGNIRVFCRVRPAKEGGTKGRVVEFPNANVGDHGRIALAGKQFEFDRVFQPSASQQEVYDETAGAVASVLDGYNVCVFAYGQTGSGKTFTMDGVDKDRGVNYRALRCLFDTAGEREVHSTVAISVSMVEIYNETLRDLIHRGGSSSQSPKLEICKDASSASATAVHVPNLTEVTVRSTEQVWDMIREGSKNRSKGRTDMNEHSSRSHLIVRVVVECEDTATNLRMRGVLNLVDLAGSERVSRSNASGDRLKEAQYINKSLSSLGDVFCALTKAQYSHVPFRNSKLTHLLQDSIGGDSKTLMFVNVSSDESDAAETLSSLRFAERVSKVQLGSGKKNVERRPQPRSGNHNAAATTRKPGEMTASSGSTLYAQPGARSSVAAIRRGALKPSTAKPPYGSKHMTAPKQSRTVQQGFDKRTNASRSLSTTGSADGSVGKTATSSGSSGSPAPSG